MNRIILTVLLLFTAGASYADHIKGGFFTYKYLRTSGTKLYYNVKLTVYMGCNPNEGQLNPTAPFTIFDAGTLGKVRDEIVSRTDDYPLQRSTDEECISGNQAVCYYHIVEYDLAEMELEANSAGYIVSFQRCCRIDGVDNLIASNSIGNTYSIKIPGSSAGTNAQQNSSTSFSINDDVVICAGNYFTYPFAGTDPDGDELRYEFCSAWTGGSQQDPAPGEATKPPYTEVNYASGFTGSQPMGPDVKIDPKTGMISGIAPAIRNTGEYVVTVCVSEIRDGRVIATNRKELHIKVAPCVPIRAVLDPVYSVCDGFTRTFENKSPNSEIKNYYWEFGDGNTSTELTPTHTYKEAGTYTLKLTVNKGVACESSTTAEVRIYPGFFPDFSFNGICVSKPTQFTDKSKTTYGTIDSWLWDFGDPNVTTDVSETQNPTYTYSQNGTYTVKLTVTNTHGCITSIVYDSVQIIDKPPIGLAFKDTLICKGDNVQLQATGGGNFTWTPQTRITNANTATPTVNPTATTQYYVELNDNGCINRDTVNVRVVNGVTLRAFNDTTICAADEASLGATTDALHYEWAPAATISNPNILNPTARPTATTTYQITARIGTCSATDQMTVHTVPYPVANAGADTLLCYETAAQLKGSVSASNFSWSPANALVNANSLTPQTTPLTQTTLFVLTVTDVQGCPKPVSDTVAVVVLPEINAFAGNDTSVVAGQPLQFLASGGTSYVWTPGTNLNNTGIADPVGVYDGSFENIRYTVLVSNEAGCRDSAFVNVRIFKTEPNVFVPTAFTPNRDGNNDIFRPIAVGLTQIEYFRVYNRWGQLVFSTTKNGHGWDGKINGKEQSSGTYAWLVKGTDYTGKVFFAKGTVTLIK
jgi:gliding motility-associated-like protein